MSNGGAQVAVAGCGYWGRNLIRNFSELGVLRAVVDSAAAGQQTAREIAPEAQVHDSMAPVLDDPDVQGVVIATPAETHFRLAREALLAGKDVFCEKPLALYYEEGRQLAELAEAQGRILMVGHIMEYHPAIRRLRDLIDDGELGSICYTYSNRVSLGKIRREENILWSFAPHDIAVILRLYGRMPFQVIASGGAYIQPNVADVTVTQLLFETGQAAHFFVSWLHPFKEQRLVVIGDRAMATFDDVAKELVLHDQRVEIEDGAPVPIRGEGRVIPYEKQEPLRLECEAFLEAIQTREQPLTDGASALRVLRVLQAAQRSLMTRGQPVMIPLDGMQ